MATTMALNIKELVAITNEHFHPPVGGMVWNEVTLKWEYTGAAFQECYPLPLLPLPDPPDPFDTDAEGMIHIMEVLDDDWKAALDILYKEDG